MVYVCSCQVFVAVAQMMHRSSGDKARGSLKILQGGETKANGGQDNEASGRKKRAKYSTNMFRMLLSCLSYYCHYYYMPYLKCIRTYNIIRIHIRFPSSTPHTPEVDSTKRMKHETPTIGRILKRCFGSQIDRGSGIGCFGIMCVCVCVTLPVHTAGFIGFLLLQDWFDYETIDLWLKYWVPWAPKTYIFR